jgi:hypothetical protein
MNKLLKIIGYNLEKLAYGWCRRTHRGVMYSGGDIYYCRTCLRKHPVPWGKLGKY